MKTAHIAEHDIVKLTSDEWYALLSDAMSRKLARPVKVRSDNICADDHGMWKQLEVYSAPFTTPLPAEAKE